MPDDNVQVPAPAGVTSPSLPPVAATDVLNGGEENPSVPNSTIPDSVSNPVVEPVVTDHVTPATASTLQNKDIGTNREGDTSDIQAEVVRKIGEADNVLVALSSDPSVDEMAAAIGLSLFLDKLGKRATAIYSGSTPNALEFLKPEETFETSADTLQDFVIALNKEKADHLRYKLDGDFVKIYITPYKTKIAEEDLEFSYGDYNVDLVLALDVANGIDLDAALREHGRIMHDAVIINITTGNPGKLGEIEWSDKTASSVSEMIAKLLYSINSKEKIEKEEATAFLTGIVAATNRFSNAKTMPGTMQVASKLMESGANQQLVSKNITPEVENELFGMPNVAETKTNDDSTKLNIEHDKKKADENKVESESKNEDVDTGETEEKSALLDDLKAAEKSLAATGAEVMPEKIEEPLKIDSKSVTDELSQDLPKEVLPETETKVVDGLAEPNQTISTQEENENSLEKPEAQILDSENFQNNEKNFVSNKQEKVVQPPDNMENLTPLKEEEAGKYGQMLENALANAEATGKEPQNVSENGNPAAAGAPVVSTKPEVNGVPEINYMPMPGDTVLPPPPTPPIDMNVPVPAEATELGQPTITAPVEPITPATPIQEPAPESLGSQPSMQDQVYAPQAADPGAFKIPGM